MQVFELHFNPKDREARACDSFCYEPENVYEKRLGNLYIIGQLSNALEPDSHFLENLAKTLKDKYYSCLTQSPAKAMGAALKEANKFLAALVKRGSVAWLGNLDLAVFALKESESKLKSSFSFNFTRVGRIKFFLKRQGQTGEIGRELELQEIEPYPPKIFFNIVSGKLKEGDRIFVFTSDFFKDGLGFAVQKISSFENFDENSVRAFFREHEPELQDFSAICFAAALDKEKADAKVITLTREPQDFSLAQALSPILTAMRKIASFLPLSFFGNSFPASTRLFVSARLSKLLSKLSAGRPRLRFSGKLKLANLAPLKKNQIKKNLLLIGVFVLMLLAGFFIFKMEKAKSVRAAREILAKTEANVLRAQNLMILEDGERANILLQEAWSEILRQERTGSVLRKEVAQVKNDIEQSLGLLNKLENIESPELLFEYSDGPQFASAMPEQDLFMTSEQSFALYFLQGRQGRIIKYPYNLNSGWGEPQNWLKDVGQQTKSAPDISGAKSIAVDGSIWVLAKDNLIHRFRLGLYQETIALNLFPLLENPSKLRASPESAELYLLEPDKKRIIILTKQGELLKQVRSEKFDKLSDFTVSSDGKTLWLLNGPKVYQIEI